MMLNLKCFAIRKAIVPLTLCFVATQASQGKIPDEIQTDLRGILDSSAIEWIAKESGRKKWLIELELEAQYEVSYEIISRKYPRDSSNSVTDKILIMLYTAPTNGLYKVLNKALREDEPLAGIQKYYDRLVQAIPRQNKNKDARLYRGLGINGNINDFKKNQVFPSFTSTTPVKGKAMEFVRKSTAGTKILLILKNVQNQGADISDLSLVPEEREVLINAGSQWQYESHVLKNGIHEITLRFKRASSQVTPMQNSDAQLQAALLASMQTTHRRPPQRKQQGGFRGYRGGRRSSYQPYGMNPRSSGNDEALHRAIAASLESYSARPHVSTRPNSHNLGYKRTGPATKQFDVEEMMKNYADITFYK